MPQPPNESKCKECGRTSQVVNLDKNCPFCHPINREWETRFDALFPNKIEHVKGPLHQPAKEKIKEFIHSELAAYRTSLCEKIEGLKEKREYLQGEYLHDAIVFNTALDKAIEIVRGK